MPELPEVETVRLGLKPVFTASAIERVELRRGNLRFPFPRDFAARLKGRRPLELYRRAKYLIAELDDGQALVMHLGMSGSFRIEEGDATETPGAFHSKRESARAHDHVVFHFARGARVIYNDPRRFGFMLLEPRDQLTSHPLFAKLGIEPLSRDMNAKALAAAFDARKAPVKSVLVDQRIIAGLGNIYACEALHRAQNLAAASRWRPRHKSGQAKRGAGAIDRRHQRGAARRRRRRRFDIARSSSNRWLARLFSTFVPRLRSGRRRLPHSRLSRRDFAHRASRTLDVLLQQVPKMNATPRLRNRQAGG